MATFESALDAVMELPVEQQERLIGIVSHRLAELRREEILQNAQEGIRLARSGSLLPLPAEKAIESLRRSLLEADEE